MDVITEEEGTVFQEQKHVHTFIKFEFIMDSLVISLFTGGSKMVKLYICRIITELI